MAHPNPHLNPHDLQATGASCLQEQAEAPAMAHAAASTGHQEDLSAENMQKMLHALRVHQIELEMQREELLRVQQVLDTERARYVDLYDLAPVGYCTLNASGLIQQANLRAATLLGMDRRALVGQPFSRFAERDFQDTLQLFLTQVFATAEPQTCELLLATPEGRLLWAYLKGTTTQNESGAPLLRMVMTDVTERKQAELALRESEQHFRTLANAGSALIWTSGLDTGFNYFNEPWLRFTGCTLAQEAGTGWTRHVHPDDLAQCLKAYASAFERRAAFSLACRLRRADGVWRWLRNDGAPRYDSQNNFLGYIGQCLDITTQTEATAELERHRNHLESLVNERTRELAQAKAVAESANVAKSVFLANMSHEIRTPLTAITGLALLMQRAGVTPQQADRLTKINAAGRHLLEIINAILDLSKIEAGKLTLERIPVDLRQVVSNVAALMLDPARHKNLRLIVDIQPLPPSITGMLGDPTRLQQALLNYTSNAIKFTPSGAITLRVSAQAILVDAVLVRFEVEDTGIGLTPEVLSRLFTAFEQGDNSTTRHFGGTGLGLTITRSLAHLMGGEVGASSRPGTGSIFWFTAQLDKAPAAVGAGTLVPVGSSEIAVVRDFPGRRVLVVEDEPVNLEVMQDLLGDLGLVIDSAVDGAQAVVLAGQHHYDLILMDVHMANMDGLEATRRIRQLPVGAQVTVIALTANAFAEDRAQCMEAGMDDFIAKPFEPEALFGTMLQWLRQPRR